MPGQHSVDFISWVLVEDLLNYVLRARHIQEKMQAQPECWLCNFCTWTLTHYCHSGHSSAPLKLDTTTKDAIGMIWMEGQHSCVKDNCIQCLMPAAVDTQTTTVARTMQSWHWTAGPALWLCFVGWMCASKPWWCTRWVITLPSLKNAKLSKESQMHCIARHCIESKNICNPKGNGLLAAKLTKSFTSLVSPCVCGLATSPNGI